MSFLATERGRNGRIHFGLLYMYSIRTLIVILPNLNFKNKMIQIRKLYCKNVMWQLAKSPKRVRNAFVGDMVKVKINFFFFT